MKCHLKLHIDTDIDNVTRDHTHCYDGLVVSDVAV